MHSSQAQSLETPSFSSAKFSFRPVLFQGASEREISQAEPIRSLLLSITALSPYHLILPSRLKLFMVTLKLYVLEQNGRV